MIVAVAIVLALVAGGASYLYLHNVQQRAYGNAKLTTVYVVQSPIFRGTLGATVVSQNLVKQSQIPTQFKPADAVTDLATLNGEVAVADLTPGEVLSSNLFVAPSVAATTTAAAIPKGDLAVTVSVGSIQDVAGLVQPGDLVDVLVNVNSKTERFLYQNAEVLAVGTTVSTPSSASAPQVASTTGSPPTTAAPVSSGLITFAVPPVAAERLAFIESGGGGEISQLYLALVPLNNKPQAEPAVDVGNLIPATITP